MLYLSFPPCLSLLSLSFFLPLLFLSLSFFVCVLCFTVLPVWRKELCPGSTLLLPTRTSLLGGLLSPLLHSQCHSCCLLTAPQPLQFRLRAPRTGRLSWVCSHPLPQTLAAEWGCLAVQWGLVQCLLWLGPLGQMRDGGSRGGYCEPPHS